MATTVTKTVCTATAWAASTAYSLGNRVLNDTPSKVYECITAGTSAGSGGPTGTGSSITDGSVTWTWIVTPDYSSLSAWESAQQGDLPTADEIRQAECYAFQDTTAVVIDGWTTDATRYCRVTVPTAERHDGKRNTSKYRLEASANWSVGLLRVIEEYVRLEGLQVKNTAANEPGGIRCDGGTGSQRISDCIVYDQTSSSAFGFLLYSCTEIIVLNCLAMNINGDGFKVGTGGFVVAYCYNCVSVNNAGYGFYVDAWRTLNCKNCYAGGNTSADFGKHADGTLNLTTNHAEDGTGNTTTAFSTSSGAYFTTITAGSEDLHITTDSALKDAGTDLSADSKWVHPDGNVDIDGDTRSSWDVGADEFVSAGEVRTPTIGSLTLTGQIPDVDSWNEPTNGPALVGAVSNLRW